MKKLNILLNIYVIIILFLNCCIIFSCCFEPYVYNNENITGKSINSYRNFEYVEGAFNKYMSYYFNRDINSLKICTVKNKIKNDEIYSKTINYIDSNKFNSLYIKSVEKKFNNVYIIYYYINSDTQYCNEKNINKLIIKLKGSNNHFLIYYDSLCEKGE